MSWRRLAQKIAKKHGWIAWIETQARYQEGIPGPIFGYETAFKENAELERCPHCGKVLVPGSDSYKQVYVSNPRNIYCWEKDETKAWKGLVEDYLKAMKISLAKLKIQLDVAGI